VPRPQSTAPRGDLCSSPRTHQRRIPSRPISTVPYRLPLSGPQGQPESKSIVRPQSVADVRVKLEDPQSLWQILRQHERSRTNTPQISEVRNAGGVNSARRIFARTVASHLALRLPYETEGATVVGVSRPEQIAHAYDIGCPRPPPVKSRGCTLRPTSARGRAAAPHAASESALSARASSEIAAAEIEVDCVYI
jgi:hypothetical protein